MSYFPTDIPFMSEKELKENGIKIPKIEAANEVVKFAEDVLHIELLPWQKYYLISEYDRQHKGPAGGARKIIETAPPVTPKQPEYHEIGYRECADAVLKMWMDNVLTDGEHNRIIDKLNAKWAIAEGDAE